MLANLDSTALLLAAAFTGFMLILFFLKNKLTPDNTPKNLVGHIARNFMRAVILATVLFVTLLIVSLFL